MSLLSVSRWSERIQGIPPSNSFWEAVDQHFPDERMERNGYMPIWNSEVGEHDGLHGLSGTERILPFLGRADRAKGMVPPDQFPFRPFAFEKNGRFYHCLHIRLWQGRVPDMSRILPALIPQKKLTTPQAAAGHGPGDLRGGVDPFSPLPDRLLLSQALERRPAVWSSAC